MRIVSSPLLRSVPSHALIRQARALYLQIIAQPDSLDGSLGKLIGASLEFMSSPSARRLNKTDDEENKGFGLESHNIRGSSRIC